MSYFRRFPKIRYSFDSGKTNKIAVDILSRVGFRDSSVEDTRVFTEYFVQDNDTPEIVADKLYGDPEFHWVVLLFNNIINPYHDWPLSTRKLESFIKNKYPGQAFFLVDGAEELPDNPTLNQAALDAHDGSQLPDVNFNRNETILGVDGNTYTNLSNVPYGSTNAALVHKWDKSLSKLEVTGVSGTYSTGDFIVVIGTSADGTTFNKTAKINRIVELNYESVHHFENPIDNTILNAFAAPPTGGTGEQNLVGNTGNYDGGSTVGVSWGDTVLNNYVVDADSTYVKTNKDFENEENEKKRKIKLIRPEYLQRVVEEFDRLIRGG